eukprot:6476551-Pyramimonas_sp.AAC.1
MVRRVLGGGGGILGRKPARDPDEDKATRIKLSAGQKALLRAVICQGYWTTSRAAAAGYSTEDQCALCGDSGDTLAHRLYFCQSEEAVELRTKLIHPDLLAKCVESADRSLVYQLGILPHPSSDPDGPPAPASEFVMEIRQVGREAYFGTHCTCKVGPLTGSDGTCT